MVGLSASASPEDWWWRGDGVAKDGGKWWSVSDRDGLTGSEWCAGPRRLRADAWRSSGAGCAGVRLSGGRLAGPLFGTPATRFSYRSVDHCYGGGCRETATRGAYRSTGARARGVRPAAWDLAAHPH